MFVLALQFAMLLVTRGSSLGPAWELKLASHQISLVKHVVRMTTAHIPPLWQTYVSMTSFTLLSYSITPCAATNRPSLPLLPAKRAPPALHVDTQQRQHYRLSFRCIAADIKQH